MPSLLEALERKYCSDCPLGADNDDAAAAGGGAGAAAEANLISIYIPRLPPLLCVPELLVLNDCDIDSAGDFETIKDKCQRVRELDLAQNKLRDWNEVFHILQHMPRIEFLNLSKNHLTGPITQFYAPSITNLRGIVLNGTYLDWLCIDVLLENLPVLEELHLSLNNYKEVLIDTADIDNDNASDKENAHDATSDVCCNDVSNSCCETAANGTAGRCKNVAVHKALKTLHFTGNPIESWHEICRLGRVFPSLENLVLADCPIKSVYVSNSKSAAAAAAGATADNTTTNTTTTTTTASPTTDEDDSPYKHFLNLLFLNLSCANINTWDDIDQLAMFPKLKNLRVKNWPLWDRLECTEHERRQLLIARLPNVSLLNGGGVITADEREDAERAFIRYYLEKPECERPKRYAELVAKHGQLEPLVNVSLKPDKRIKVLLTFKETSEPRLVDIYRTVADLKVKLEKIVGLPANKMRLYYLDQDYKEFGPEEMRFPNKFLYSYNIQAGDEIIVDEKK